MGLVIGKFFGTFSNRITLITQLPAIFKRITYLFLNHALPVVS